MECIFCAIARKELVSEVVYENETAISFLDTHPHAPGHTVVVTKSHRETILEVTKGEMTGLAGAVKSTAAVLLKGLHADGLTIGINQGRAAGQAIPHLHVHLLPRYANDGGGSLHSVVKNPPKESLESIANKIRSIISYK